MFQLKQCIIFLPCTNQDSEKAGYKGHMACLEGFKKILGNLSQQKEDIRIMDAGAGTGFIGEYLKQQGYTNVDGLDISQEMLDIAKEKNVYKKLICAPLSEKKISEVPTGEYHVLLSAGTIVYGQVEAGALEEIARMVKPGELLRAMAQDGRTTLRICAWNVICQTNHHFYGGIDAFRVSTTKMSAELFLAI